MRSGGIAMPCPANRALHVARDRDASLVTMANGVPRRVSSAISAAAPGRMPLASTSTP
jgi:hypothetical protein